MPAASSREPVCYFGSWTATLHPALFGGGEGINNHITPVTALPRSTKIAFHSGSSSCSASPRQLPALRAGPRGGPRRGAGLGAPPARLFQPRSPSACLPPPLRGVARPFGAARGRMAHSCSAKPSLHLTSASHRSPGCTEPCAGGSRDQLTERRDG